MGKFSIAQGTITSNENALNITGTWNNAGTAFKGILANFTDTASLGTSVIIDLQRNSSTVFKVDKYGTTTVGGNLNVVGTTTLSSPLDLNSNKKH
jgi:hypothetical protein